MLYVIQDWKRIIAFKLGEEGILDSGSPSNELFSCEGKQNISDFLILENGSLVTLTRNGYLKINQGALQDNPGQEIASYLYELESVTEQSCYSLAVDESAGPDEAHIIIHIEKKSRRHSIAWVKLTIDSFMQTVNLDLQSSIQVKHSRHGNFFRALQFIRGDSGAMYLVANEYENDPCVVMFFKLDELEGIVKVSAGDVESDYHRGDWVYRFCTWKNDKLFSIDEKGNLVVLAVSD